MQGKSSEQGGAREGECPAHQQVWQLNGFPVPLAFPTWLGKVLAHVSPSAREGRGGGGQIPIRQGPQQGDSPLPSGMCVKSSNSLQLGRTSAG